MLSTHSHSCTSACVRLLYSNRKKVGSAYCRAGNFRGVQFSQMVDLYHFRGFNFHGHSHSLPLCSIQLSLFCGPHENFPLYSMRKLQGVGAGGGCASSSMKHRSFSICNMHEGVTIPTATVYNPQTSH